MTTFEITEDGLIHEVESDEDDQEFEAEEMNFDA